MKLTATLLSLFFCLPAVLAANTEWLIDFGLHKDYNAQYGGRTTTPGWNNVAVVEKENWETFIFTEQGAAPLNAAFFISGASTPDELQTSQQTVSIFDSLNQKDPLTLSIIKNTADGTLQTISGSGSNMAQDTYYTKFGYTVPENIPTSASRDHIFASDNTSFTLVLSGFAAGQYNICALAGMGYAYGGTTPTVTYSLNGVTQTLTGNDGTSGQYASVMNWENVTLDEMTTLSLTVEGQLGADNYGGSSYTKAAINAMIITMVPEPATATLSLLALCGLAARRRRS